MNTYLFLVTSNEHEWIQMYFTANFADERRFSMSFQFFHVNLEYSMFDVLSCSTYLAVSFSQLLAAHCRLLIDSLELCAGG